MDLSPDRAALRALLFELHDKRCRQDAVLVHKVETTREDLAAKERRQAELRFASENSRVAAGVLQNLVDAVASRNIAKVESLVNSALSTIFTDLDLSFRIVSEVKRNQNIYRIAIFENGREGNINSYGGGVIAVVSMVLKLLFNVLAKRYPFIAMDESLAFVSEAYIEAASAFIRDMAEEFGMPVLLVTHQPKFSASADRVYHMKSVGPSTSTIQLKA